MRLFTSLGLGLLLATQAIAQQASGDWSASLLERMLGAPAATQAQPEAEGQGLRRPSATPPSLPQEGMVVRVYQLRRAQIGSPEVDTKINVLERLIPAGSVLKKDSPSNSISVLTSPSVQEAVYTFLSAIDTPPAPTTQEIPPAVQQALTQLAASNKESAKLLDSIGAIRSEIKGDVAKQLADLSTRTSHQLRWYGLGGAVLATVFAVFLWLSRKSDDEVKAGTQLALMPKVNQALVEQVRNGQELAREDMRMVLAGFAKKMTDERQQLVKQTQDGQLMLAEMKVQMTELALDRERVLNRAESMLKGAVEKFESNTEVLQTEQGRLQEMAILLTQTLKEVDGTRDLLQNEQIETQKVRYALEKERAKVAALSILLEDGQFPEPEAAPAPDFPIFPAPVTEAAAEPTPSPVDVAEPVPIEPVSVEQSVEQPVVAEIEVVVEPPVEAVGKIVPQPPPARRFTFLPPDAPDMVVA